MDAVETNPENDPVAAPADAFVEQWRDGIAFTDTAGYWACAGSWVLRVSATIAAAKIGLTLLWANLTDVGVRLGWWFKIIPHWEFEVSQDRFVRLVTLSTWFSLIGMVVGVIAAEVSLHRGLRRAERMNDSDSGYGPAVSEAAAAWRLLIADAEASGKRTGAFIGALAVLVTIVLELVRDRIFGEYVWPTPHLAAITLAGIPLLGLIAIAFIGSARERVPAAPFAVLFPQAGESNTHPHQQGEHQP